jgi:hypothetical protein
MSRDTEDLKRGALRVGRSSHMLRRAMKKSTSLPHRNRKKSVRYRAKRKAKHRRVRLRVSKGERKYA